MPQGRTTKIISTIKWIRASRSSIKNSLSLHDHDWELRLNFVLFTSPSGATCQGLTYWEIILLITSLGARP